MDIEKYKVEKGEEATPVIVLTGTVQEFEEFCSKTNRNTKTAIAVRQGFQLDLYPGLDIITYGSYGINQAFESQEYIKRTRFDEMEKVRRILK